jgi:uncharacterized membrane protein YczE
MPGIGTWVASIGLIMILVGHYWIVAMAFQKSLLWGAASLLVPVVVIGFVISHWDKVAKPFGLYIVGWLTMLLGAALTHGAFSELAVHCCLTGHEGQVEGMNQPTRWSPRHTTLGRSDRARLSG